MDDLFIAAFGLDKRKNQVTDNSKNFFEKVDNDDTIFLKEIVNGSIREIKATWAWATWCQELLVINNERECDDLEFSVQVLGVDEDGIRVLTRGKIYGLGETRLLPGVSSANQIKIPFPEPLRLISQVEAVQRLLFRIPINLRVVVIRMYFRRMQR